MNKPTENLDIEELMKVEMRALANEYICETWREVSIEDLDTKMVAQVFIEESLKHVAKELGEQHASNLLAQVRKMEEIGFLAEDRVLQ